MRKKNFQKINAHVFLRFASPYLLILLILMTLSLTTGQVAFRSQIEQSMEYYNQSLKTSLDSIERTMATIDSLNDMLNRNTDLQNIMYTIRQERPLKELLAWKERQVSFHDTNKILAGYAVCANNTGVIVTDKRIFMDPERCYEDFLKYNDLSFEEWKALLPTISNKGKFVPVGNVRPGSLEEGRYIMYVKPYIHLEKGRITGQNIFYMDEREIMGMVAAALANEDIIVRLSDWDKVLSSSGEWGETENAISVDSGNHYEKVTIEGAEYYVTVATSEKYGLSLAAGVPGERLKAVSYERLSTLNICIGILFVLVLAVAGATILKNRQALIGLGEIEKGVENLRSVHEAVVRIKTDNQRLDLQIDAQRMLLRESLFRQIVNGFSGDDMQMEQQLEYAGIQLGGEEISARGVYLVMDEDLAGISNAVLRGQEKRLAQVEQILETYAPKIEYLFMEERNCLVLLYFSERENDFTVFSDIYQKLAADYDITVHFYLGKQFTQLHQAKDSFSEARLQMRIDTQQDERFLVVSSDELAKDIFSYSSHDEEKLLSIILSGEKDAAGDILREIYRANFENRCLSVHMRGFLYGRLVTTLLCVENNVPLTAPELLAPRGDCRPETFFRVYWEQICGICEQIYRERQQAYRELDEQMICYVKEHFQENSLSLTELAIQYGRSESYVSLRLKEILGESFSGYLEKLRVNAANRLLEEDRYSIKEIAEMVGYNSASAFGRAYKRVTGITPSEYQTQQKTKRSKKDE